MSSVRNFHAHLAREGFWKVIAIWSVLWSISALAMYFGLKAWLITSGVFAGLVAVPLLFVTIRFWLADRSLASLKKQLEQMSAENEARQRQHHQQQASPAEKRIRCERCACKTLMRSDGKRTDPHYGGLCLLCDGTGFLDPAKFKAVK